MKIVLFFILLFTIVSNGFTQTYDYSDYPVAVTDNMFTPKVNPAALAFGSSSGFGCLLGAKPLDKIDYQNMDEFNDVIDNLSLYFNMGLLAYVYEYANNNHFHEFAAGVKLLPNGYLGSSIAFQNGDIEKSEYDISFVYRPLDFLSLGSTIHNVFSDDRIIKMGIGIRPLLFSNEWINRVTIALDTSYTNNEFILPTINLRSELVDGININGSYNIQDKNFSIGFAYNIGTISTGIMASFNEEVQLAGNDLYSFISSKEYKSVLNIKKLRFIDYKPGPEILERQVIQKFGPYIFQQDADTLAKVLDEIDSLAKDNTVAGLVFINHNFNTTFANLLDIYKALIEFKESGKKIIFYFENTGHTNYALAASVADKIYLNPLGQISLQGFGVATPYLKDFFNKILGINFISLQSHEYKTANHILTESEMTTEEREALTYVFNGLHDELIRLIKTGRGNKLNTPIQEVIDKGPYLIADDALKAGLVDELIYEEELEYKLRLINRNAVMEEYRPSNKMRYNWSEPVKQNIAIIYATGNIYTGDGVPGQTIGSNTTARAIRMARENKLIKGIILRVDSGGGSAIASDIIAHEIELCRKGENAKPVVVSMGGMAASGGYYISCLADKIIAQPVTITGSIGVTGMLLNLEDLFKKLGINWSIVKTGEHADLGNPARAPNDEELNIFRNMIKNIYDVFVKIVARGRNKNYDDIHEIAKGRIWTGLQALERGLVDQLGGLKDSIDAVKELANIQGEIRLVEYTGLDNIFYLFTMPEETAILFQKPIDTRLKALIDEVEMLQKYSDDKVLMFMPYSFE